MRTLREIALARRAEPTLSIASPGPSYDPPPMAAEPQKPRHLREVPVFKTPMDPEYMPRHCAGSNACLHKHPEDAVCDCGETLLEPHVDGLVMQRATGITNVVRSVRRSRQSCHTVATSYARSETYR